MLPVVLNEDQVHHFTFYSDAAIAEGMQYGAEIYGLAYRFATYERLAAYSFAADLSETGCTSLITLSQAGYTVWVRLSDNEYPHWHVVQKAVESWEPGNKAIQVA